MQVQFGIIVTSLKKTNLEKIHKEAARIVTGLTRSVCLNRLYRETGWLPLSDRRLYQKLILMYKIKNRMVPSDLTALFLRNTDHPLGYNLRSRNDFVTLPRGTTLFAN